MRGYFIVKPSNWSENNDYFHVKPEEDSVMYESSRNNTYLCGFWSDKIRSFVREYNQAPFGISAIKNGNRISVKVHFFVCKKTLKNLFGCISHRKSEVLFPQSFCSEIFLKEDVMGTSFELCFSGRNLVLKQTYCYHNGKTRVTETVVECCEPF